MSDNIAVDVAVTLAMVQAEADRQRRIQACHETIRDFESRAGVRSIADRRAYADAVQFLYPVESEDCPWCWRVLLCFVLPYEGLLFACGYGPENPALQGLPHLLGTQAHSVADGLWTMFFGSLLTAGAAAIGGWVAYVAFRKLKLIPAALMAIALAAAGFGFWWFVLRTPGPDYSADPLDRPYPPSVEQGVQAPNTYYRAAP